MAYSIYIPELKWTIVIGIYVDDIQKQMITLKNQIQDETNKFQDGLINFFKYLNKQTSEVEFVELNSKDELGQMSKILNENIKIAQKDIEEDRHIIEDTIKVLGEFQKGDLSQRLLTDVSNEALIKLKSVLNNMAENLEKILIMF